MKCNSSLKIFIVFLFFLTFPLKVLAGNYGEGDYSAGNYNVGATPSPEPTVAPTASPTSSISVITDSGSSTCNNQKPIGISPWLYSGSVVNGTSIDLSFINYQSPINKFVIEYGTKSGEYKYAVDGIPDTLTNFTVEKLKFNTVYYFRIRAGNGCAVGSWSNEIAVKTANIIAFDRLNISNTSIEENNNSINQISITNYDVKIKVVDENQKPIVGAKVILHSDPMETTTDKNGIATFSNVEKGDHKLLIAYGEFKGEQSINLSGDNKETNLNIVVTEQKKY